MDLRLNFDPVGATGAPEEALKAWREGVAIPGAPQPPGYLGVAPVPSIGYPSPLPTARPVYYQPGGGGGQFGWPGPALGPPWGVPEAPLFGMAGMGHCKGCPHATADQAAIGPAAWLQGFLGHGVLPTGYPAELPVPEAGAWGVRQFGSLEGGLSNPVPPMHSIPFVMPQVQGYVPPFVPPAPVAAQGVAARGVGPAVPEHVVRGQVYVPQQASVGLPIGAAASQPTSLVEPSFPSLPVFAAGAAEQRANSAPGRASEAAWEGQHDRPARRDDDSKAEAGSEGPDQGAVASRVGNCRTADGNLGASKGGGDEQCRNVQEGVKAYAGSLVPVENEPHGLDKPEAAQSEAEGDDRGLGTNPTFESGHRQLASQPAAETADHSGGSQTRSTEVVHRSAHSVVMGQEPAPTFHPLPPMFVDPPQRMSSWSARSRSIPTMAVLQNCRQEDQMVSEHTDSHQEMSLMLAIPGLAIGRAPMLTLQQAGSMLRAISEPLACLKVGRLTRKLGANPRLLRATEDVGMLTLWLSPSSDVSVIWHAIKSPEDEESCSGAGVEDASRATHRGEPIIEFAEGFHEEFSIMEASEELAWVAADSTCPSEGSGVKLEMVEQDPSGRSFRLVRRSNHLRQKQELAKRLDAEKAKAGGRVSSELAKLYDLLNACNSEPDTEDNFHFWIAEKSLPKGLQDLKSMSDQLKTLPTLSEKSGVPQRKLQEVCQWFAKAAEASQQIPDSDSPADGASSQTPERTAEASPPQAHLPLPSHMMATLNPTYLMDALFQENPGSPREAEADGEGQEEGEPGSRHVSESCASSATANFLVSDKQLGMTLLSTASVTVAVGVEGTTEVMSVEEAHRTASDSAHQLAKKRAEQGARVEAERLGRRRLEELAAERASKGGSHPKASRDVEHGKQSASVVDSTQHQPMASAAEPAPRVSNAKAADEGETSRVAFESRKSTGSGSSVGSISAEELRQRNSLPVQMEWRPRISGSTRGWGGKDLSDVNSVSFASSSPLDKTESLLSHNQAFGTHGKAANWSNTVNMGAIPCLGLPSLIPAHHSLTPGGLHSGYLGQMGLPRVPAVPCPPVLPTPHQLPASQWWQGAWSPTAGNPLECQSSGQFPHGMPVQHIPRFPTASQWLTPIHAGQMPFHHYGRTQGHQGVQLQEGVPVPGGDEARHGWGVAQGQWPNLPPWTLVDQQGGPSLRTGWGGGDAEPTDKLGSLVGKGGASGERRGSFEGMKRRSGELRRN